MKENTIILEGLISVREAVRAQNRVIERVCVQSGKLFGNSLSDLWRLTKSNGIPLEFFDKPAFLSLVNGRSCGGVMAFAGERKYLTPAQLTETCRGGMLAILEGFEDPYNFGYGVRTLYAAGFAGVLTSRNQWNGNDGVYVKASAGATEHMPIAHIHDYDETIEQLRLAGYVIICAIQSKQSISLYDVPVSRPCAVVIGGEKRGISKPLLNQADVSFEIPYGREFDYALPGVAAASIIAFEMKRKSNLAVPSQG